MTVNVENGAVVSITGNSCKRGVEYAAQESIAPKRMVTAVVLVVDRAMPLSVKTRSPIPKQQIFACMQEIKSLHLCAPIHMGDIVCANVCGTGVDVIATKTIE